MENRATTFLMEPVTVCKNDNGRALFNGTVIHINYFQDEAHKMLPGTKFALGKI